ncbi:MAG: hypothetical protein NUV56_01960, partial [Candidatus Uhrbacteria bacterium]|nr:hypothetical protein [Candidatus Uhrbacteria bacterium]
GGVTGGFVRLRDLPLEWQRYFTQINELIARQQYTQRALMLGFFVAIAVIVYLVWRMWRPPFLLRPNVPLSPMSVACNTLVNQALADGYAFHDDLRRGVARMGDILLVSTAITIRLENAREAVSDARMRAMIIEDVDSGNGIALRVFAGGDVGEPSTAVELDRIEYRAWRESLGIPAGG